MGRERKMNQPAVAVTPKRSYMWSCRPGLRLTCCCFVSLHGGERRTKFDHFDGPGGGAGRKKIDGNLTSHSLTVKSRGGLDARQF